VKLNIDGESIPLEPDEDGKVLSNKVDIELRAGALYKASLTVEKVKDTLKVQWQTFGQGWQVIPAQYLYSDTLMDHLRTIYIRFLKVVSLAESLRLSAKEMAYLFTPDNYQEIQYKHHQATLEKHIRDAAKCIDPDEEKCIDYDDAKNRLYFKGILSAHICDSLKNAGNKTLSTTEAENFDDAVNQLYFKGQGWLNNLPVSAISDEATSEKLYNKFRALLNYSRIKSDLSPEDDRLLTVLKDPTTKIKKGVGDKTEEKELLTILTRWKSDSLNTLLPHFGKADKNDLKDLNTFVRVYKAQAIIKKLGIPASALIKATTNDPKPAITHDFQAALRARYDEDDWLNILKPINDEMRVLQRDALVAFILHQMCSDTTLEHINTPERLFEYFLMDVQMEPCMETSRIRHALSSVQLFIDRCLMNLEPRVAPASINADQWKWMNRYRVWEANRKVFLYPENWLEPELRDDQSPFFKETIGELLQGDITEDRAAGALLNYLSKLEEVAKLEPCGIHYVEAEDSGNENDITHVVSRTAGANRKYYYRRREGGSWTPWEHIKLDIEDNPVVPVVWKGRLFLFWLRILKQSPMDKSGLNGTTVFGEKDTLANVHLSKIIKKDLPQIIVKAMLCYSEFYNGKWQPTKTSDVNDPIEIDTDGPDEFDRSNIILSVYKKTDSDPLFIGIVYNKETAPNIGPVYKKEKSSFRLYNTHSLPVDGEKDCPADTPEYIKRTHMKYISEQKQIWPTHILKGGWNVPFFYEDSRHTFYVTVTGDIGRIPDYNGYRIEPPPSEKQMKDPPIGRPLDPESRRIGPGGLLIGGLNFSLVGPPALGHNNYKNTHIRRVISNYGTVLYDGVEIGPAGRHMTRNVKK
jgi:hypothetical protein